MSVPFSVSGVAPIRRFVCLFLFFIAFFTDFYSATGFWPCRRFLWEKKKQLVLFFSSSLYLFLTDLFLISPSCTLLVYGLIFAAFSARPVSQVLASSMAGIFLVSCIYQCGFFLFDLFPVSGIWELLADLGCALVSLLLLCRFGRYLRSISAPSGIFLPAPLCRLLFCWFVLGEVLLYAPAFWVPCLLILLTAVSFLLFGLPFKTPVSAAKTGRGDPLSSDPYLLYGKSGADQSPASEV